MTHLVFRDRQGRIGRKSWRGERFGAGSGAEEARLVTQACAKSHSKCATPSHQSRENTGKHGAFRDLCNRERDAGKERSSGV
jgi:hypothetical protein